MLSMRCQVTSARCSESKGFSIASMSTQSRISSAWWSPWPAPLSPTAFRTPRYCSKGKGNVFQRLDDLADLFVTHARYDVRLVVGKRWPELVRTWAGRHVYVHKDGLVDERYVRAVPATALRLGQRLPVTEADARSAIENVRALVDAIARGHDDPPS